MSESGANRGNVMTAPAEIVLAHIWNTQWLAKSLTMTDGRGLRVVYPGVWTHGLGPDFSGAYLDIAGRLEHGSVEIHRRASDWFAHGHHLDTAYDSVILHVVHTADGPPARRRDGRLLPTIELRSHLPGPLDTFSTDPPFRPLGSIGFDHCAPNVAREHPDAVRNVWEAAGDARLRAKVALVSGRLALEPPAQVLYGMFLDALGFTQNREGMRAISERLTFRQVDLQLAGHPSSERFLRAAGLLLGVGGFLPLAQLETEIIDLSVGEREALNEVWQQIGAPWYDLRLPATTWSLRRTRPAAHPIRRLLGFAHFLSRLHGSLIEDLGTALTRDGDAGSARSWITHQNPYIGESHAHEMVVNVVVPFAFAYGEATDRTALIEAAAWLWEQLPAGRGNAEVRKTRHLICGDHRVPIRSARAEQGLLHLSRTGCALMRCHECPIARLALEAEHHSLEP